MLVVVWLWARHGQRPRRWTVVGIALAIVGLVLVLDVLGGIRVDVAGVLWALGAAAGLAAFFVLSGRDDTGPPTARDGGCGSRDRQRRARSRRARWDRDDVRHDRRCSPRRPDPAVVGPGRRAQNRRRSVRVRSRRRRDPAARIEGGFVRRSVGGPVQRPRSRGCCWASCPGPCRWWAERSSSPASSPSATTSSPGPRTPSATDRGEQPQAGSRHIGHSGGPSAPANSPVATNPTRSYRARDRVLLASR